MEGSKCGKFRIFSRRKEAPVCEFFKTTCDGDMQTKLEQAQKGEKHRKTIIYTWNPKLTANG